MFMNDIKADDLTAQFRAMIRDAKYPCVGAKSALNHDHIEIRVAMDIRCPADDARIHAALAEFATRYKIDPQPFQSLAVLFRGPEDLSEKGFEQALWRRVQALSDIDAGKHQPYDPRVSPDAGDPHFSLSFGGEAFFLVGLHPQSSRPARRFMTPALVFNPHDQFERLRALGRYETLSKAIISRDVALAGSPNPMLAVHGDMSAARQYSGRAVSGNWRCPFEPHHEELHDDR
jgi:FPC/CPF motif-containing protein YcgG